MTRRSSLRCGVDISVRPEVSWPAAVRDRGRPSWCGLLPAACCRRSTWPRCALRGSAKLVRARRPRGRACAHRLLRRARARARRRRGAGVTDRRDRGVPGSPGPGEPRAGGAHAADARALRPGGPRLCVLRLRDARVLQRDVRGRRTRARGAGEGGRADGRPRRARSSRRPGTLARAMGLSRAHDGDDLTEPPVYLCGRAKRPRIAVSARVGVAYAGPWADKPWRFYDPASRHVSKPPAKAIGRGPAGVGKGEPPSRKAARRGD